MIVGGGWWVPVWVVKESRELLRDQVSLPSTGTEGCQPYTFKNPLVVVPALPEIPLPLSAAHSCRCCRAAMFVHTGYTRVGGRYDCPFRRGEEHVGFSLWGGGDGLSPPKLGGGFGKRAQLTICGPLLILCPALKRWGPPKTARVM